MQIFQQSPLTSLILMTNTDVSTNKAIDHVSTTEHATMEKVKNKKHLNFSSSFYPNQCLRTILGEVRPHLAKNQWLVIWLFSLPSFRRARIQELCAQLESRQAGERDKTS
jgi:hypothetical protein